MNIFERYFIKRSDGFWIGPFLWVAIWLTVLVVIVDEAAT